MPNGQRPQERVASQALGFRTPTTRTTGAGCESTSKQRRSCCWQPRQAIAGGYPLATELAEVGPVQAAWHVLGLKCRSARVPLAVSTSAAVYGELLKPVRNLTRAEH